VALDDWPLFGLEIATPRVVLRAPRDDDFPGLLAAIDAGVHDPTTMPFSVAWTDADPGPRRIGAMQHWWSKRAAFAAHDWHLSLAVFEAGRAIGCQDVFATSFLELRTVNTGSWLTLGVQGRGLGREMRAAVLAFAFETLGAEVARARSWTTRRRSLCRAPLATKRTASVASCGGVDLRSSSICGSRATGGAMSGLTSRSPCAGSSRAARCSGPPSRSRSLTGSPE
jgi:RimJ/RimL family protein N-acetyltransferase